jgi:adenosylcobinamide-GDP ribazoletransferase
MRSLLRALGFLSILPLGRAAHFDKQHIPGVLAAFPLAGALLGALLGVLWYGLMQVFMYTPATAMLIGAWLLLTRAFHLDGLADCADGLGGGYTRERRLAIMKDPHIGVFGTTAIIGVLLIKFSCLLHWPEFVLSPPRHVLSAHSPLMASVLTFALVLSSARFAVLVGACGSTYARAPESGLGQDFIASTKMWVVIAGAIVPAALALILYSKQACAVLAAAVCIALLLRWIFNRAIGGQTGDTLGATVELAEAAALIVLSARWTSGE